jgi:hypothetical protein
MPGRKYIYVAFLVTNALVQQMVHIAARFAITQLTLIVRYGQRHLRRLPSTA